MAVNLRVSVRDLVSHGLSTGDLVYGFTGSGRLIKAIRAHQKIQRRRPAGYQPEVTVSHTVESPAIRLKIGGRIDGVWPTDAGILIEEIKTTTQPSETAIEKENPLHWGQLKCYAYMYAVAHDLETIKGQLTYYHLETGRTFEYRQVFELKPLADFFNGLVLNYLTWMETVAGWQIRRNAAIHQTPFPYPHYRPGQRQMAVVVFRTIRDKVHLMIQAATGIGKTMAVLFPAIKALGKELTKKIFYLTARTTGRLAAEKTLAILRKNGLAIKSLTLTAKDKICFEPDAACNPEECPFAKGYYDRYRAAVETAFKKDALTRTVIEDICRRFDICPFAFSLELTNWVDVIICDYNYVFDPRVSLKELLEEQKQSCIFLVDEAHNLVDRSREMFSATLTKHPFLTVRRMFKGNLSGLHRRMGHINQCFLKIRKQGEDDTAPRIETSAPEGLISTLSTFVHETDRWLAKNKKTAYREPLLELYFNVTNFLRVIETYDDRYVTCYEPKDRDYQITLFCIDPSFQLATALKRSCSAVFFSATLTPMDYFIDLFGSGKNTRRLIVPSPFPPQNQCVIICTRISTRYRTRNQTRPAVLAAIRTILDAKPGNYLFYFPSHEYMRDIHALFDDIGSNGAVKVQTPSMTETERENFIGHFSKKKSGSRLAFAVMGGIFGEGIDLAGDRLNGVAIVGVGLP
ncbi:MAG: ATP-dependent DNA helicase, partial [Thermodesulfobacteriota bacterium]|nr:ATP-dependent DNA helicase [Thermodesulfobacteriota bacterium]